MNLRTDLSLISEWVEAGAHVLDLGCGNCALLAYLRDTKQVTGYGLEIDTENIIHCLEKGVNVIDTDLNKGLLDFVDNSFDYVIMSQTLQAIHRPDLLLREMLRVGREGIVTFPNFGHWSCRLQLTVNGEMPMSQVLVNEWYKTENIHLCTLRDFEKLCKAQYIEILQRAVVDMTHRTHWLMQIWPNMFGEIALYRFRRKQK